MTGSALSPDSEAIATVTAITTASGTSFGGAMRILPPERRDGMFAVYAFCRVVDDIADEPAPEADKLARLAIWRDRIEAICAGRANQADPLDRALAWVVGRFGCRREDFLAVLDGMAMDAPARVRIADGETLTLYCDRVACAVGRLSNPVFGIPPADSRALAAAVGHALQLTNILRDVAEDAANNRVYLPADRLAAHGLGAIAEDATASLDHPAVPKVRAELAALAEARFAEADALFRRLPKRPARPARVMKEVYHALFRRLMARGWESVRGPVVRVPKPVKIWLAVWHGLL